MTSREPKVKTLKDLEKKLKRKRIMKAKAAIQEDMNRKVKDEIFKKAYEETYKQQREIQMKEELKNELFLLYKGRYPELENPQIKSLIFSETGIKLPYTLFENKGINELSVGIMKSKGKQKEKLIEEKKKHQFETAEAEEKKQRELRALDDDIKKKQEAYDKLAADQNKAKSKKAYDELQAAEKERRKKEDELLKYQPLRENFLREKNKKAAELEALSDGIRKAEIDYNEMLGHEHAVKAELTQMHIKYKREYERIRNEGAEKGVNARPDSHKEMKALKVEIVKRQEFLDKIPFTRSQLEAEAAHIDRLAHEFEDFKQLEPPKSGLVTPKKPLAAPTSFDYLQLKTYQRNLRRIIEDAETRGVNADVYKKRFEKATKNLQSMLNDVVKTEPIMTNDSYVDFTLLNAHRTYLIDHGLAVDPQID